MLDYSLVFYIPLQESERENTSFLNEFKVDIGVQKFSVVHFLCDG